jgi:hypothetical protein
MSRTRIYSSVLWFVLSLSLSAQTPDTATIHGQVIDQSRAGVDGVRVSAKNTLTGHEHTAQTDASGNFTLAGLPIAGDYQITATRQGFADAGPVTVTLVGGSTADVSLQLNVAGGQSQVTVTGVVGEVRADEPQLGTHLSAAQMQEMPLLNRKITYLPLLNSANRPAINQGDVFMNQTMFTTNGAGRRQAWYEVDGSNAVDMWGRQTVFSTLPLASLQEMTILENPFSAEYGASLGGVLNVVTRTGGNRFHAQFLALWRPDATSAKLSGFTAANATGGNDWISDYLLQGGVSLSGPLGSSGRTQFSFDGEFSGENRGSPVISPVAPGNFVGHYRSWPIFFRLDHQINDKNSLFFRGDVDGFYDTNPNGAVGGNNLPTVDRVFRRRTYSTELGETASLSPTLLNNVRLQFQLASPITQFDPVIYGTQYQVPITAGGTFTTGTSQSALLLNHQYEFSDVLSAVRGRHQVKFGADVIYAHNGGNSKEFGGPIYLGQFVYNTCAGTLAFCESSAYLGDIRNVRTYTQSYGNAAYTVGDALWALFVQDDIRLRPDFTVNLGLRYEQQTFTDDRNNFSPRVGFSYNVRGDGKTVIRGGFGIFYSQIPDNSQANYSLTGPTGVFNYSVTPGQVGFPTTVASAPLPAFPGGAPVPLRSLYLRPGDGSYYNQYFPTSTLTGYPDKLLNPYSEQWTIGIERRLLPNWVLSVDYVGSHTLKINRPLDVDPPSPFVRTAPGQTRSAQAANCTRPYWIWWYQQNDLTCSTTAATNPQPPYAVIQSDVNNGIGWYDALNVNLSHNFSRRLQMLVSYTWSHTLDTVDPDVPSQNPNDPNFTGSIEKGNAIFDQRQRFVLSGVYTAPYKINFGGIVTLGSGLPYNIVTGTTNSGDTGSTTDRPVVNGVVIGRNIGRGGSIYDVSPFIGRPFNFGDRFHLDVKVEAFNVFNQANFVGYSGTWGNANTPGIGFGSPLAGITNQLPARSLQFQFKLGF